MEPIDTTIEIIQDFKNKKTKIKVKGDSPHTITIDQDVYVVLFKTILEEQLSSVFVAKHVPPALPPGTSFAKTDIFENSEGYAGPFPEYNKITKSPIE